MTTFRATPQAPSRPAAGRWWQVAVVAGCLLLVPGCTSAGPDEPDGSPTGASATSTGPVIPSGPPASTAPAVGASTAPPVGVSSPAAFGDGLEATVTKIAEVDLEGEGPGEVAGPGTAVSVTLRNGTTARVDLGGIVVGATYADGTPGDPSTSAPSDVPTGILEPGDSAEGVWVFSRPAKDAGAVEVSVSSISSATVVTVRS